MFEMPFRRPSVLALILLQEGPDRRLGGESAVIPNREIVFRVCVCVACVRAKLCEGPLSRDFQGYMPSPGARPGSGYFVLHFCPKHGSRGAQKEVQGGSWKGSGGGNGDGSLEPPRAPRILLSRLRAL